MFNRFVLRVEVHSFKGGRVVNYKKLKLLSSVLSEQVTKFFVCLQHVVLITN